MSENGTSRRFAAMQWFVGYRRLSGLSQASRRAFYEFTCLGAGLDFAQARLYVGKAAF